MLLLHPPPHIKIFIMGKNFHLFWVLILVEEGPFQLEIISHLGQPSCFHCGEYGFQNLCTGYAMLPPPPHNKIFMMGKNIHLFWVLSFVGEGPFELEIISHLGQPICFHCREFDF